MEMASGSVRRARSAFQRQIRGRTSKVLPVDRRKLRLAASARADQAHGPSMALDVLSRGPTTRQPARNRAHEQVQGNLEGVSAP